MRLFAVAFGLLFASAYAQFNQANFNNEWPIVAAQAIPLRSSSDANNQAIVTEVEVPSDGRLFFNLLATTTTTTTTVTSTCTVSTSSACASGKKRRSVLLWKDEHDGDELERKDVPASLIEEEKKDKREANPQFYPYYSQYGVQPSQFGHGYPSFPPYYPQHHQPSPPYYNPGFQQQYGAPVYANRQQQQQAHARLLFNLITITSTVTTTTTSRSTPTCSSSSSFTQC